MTSNHDELEPAPEADPAAPDLATWVLLATRYGLPIPCPGQEVAAAIIELAVALLERLGPHLEELTE